MNKLKQATTIIALCALSFLIGRYSSVENTKQIQENDATALNDELGLLNDNAILPPKLDDKPPMQNAKSPQVSGESLSIKESLYKALQTNDELARENDQLEKQIEKLKLDYQLLDASFTMAKAKLEQNQIGFESVPLEKLQEVVNSPIAELVAGSPLSRDVFNHASQAQDFEWASVMEQRISDFFITHELNYAFRLDKVTCKKTSCDILGYELEQESVDVMLEDIIKEPWWSFKHRSKFRSPPSAEGTVFYMLLKNSFS